MGKREDYNKKYSTYIEDLLKNHRRWINPTGGFATYNILPNRNSDHG